MSKVYSSKAALIQQLQSNIRNNDAIAIKALLKVYDNQLAFEKATASTVYSNNIGFTHSDAKFLTSLATYAKRNGTLTSNQLWHLHKRMPKYANQLVNQSIENGLIKKSNGKYIW